MKQNPKIFFTVQILFAAVFLVLALPLYAAQPGVSIFAGLHSNDSIGQIDYNNLVGYRDRNGFVHTGLIDSFNNQGIPTSMYQGKPLYFINTPTPELFGSIGNFLQESTTPSNIVWWAGHGTLNAPGGWDNTYVGRKDFFARTRQISDSLGKDTIIVDNSCGSGACVLPDVSQYLGGHLKGVITISGAGQYGYTGQLEAMLQGAGQYTAGVDRNKDGALSLGEIKRYSEEKGLPFQFAGDMNHKVFYSKDASVEKNPELADNVCVVLPPGRSRDYSEEFNDDLADVGYVASLDAMKQSARNQKAEHSRIYFFTPSESDARTFLASLQSGNPEYVINGLRIQPGNYGIGKTILLDKASNASHSAAYFKVTGSESCAAEPIKYETPGSGSGTLGTPGSIGNSLSNLGSNPLLPLLMQGLLGQGLGGGQGGYGANNPYNNPYNPYTQQRQNCALQGTSPVCGTDGRTYTNLCYLQQANIQLRTYGICPTAGSTSSPQATPTPNATSILTQLTSSGIPASLLDAIRNIVARMLSNILSGGVIAETVVR